MASILHRQNLMPYFEAGTVLANYISHDNSNSVKYAVIGSLSILKYHDAANDLTRISSYENANKLRICSTRCVWPDR